MSKRYWKVDFELYHNGRWATFSELSRAAKARIYGSVGRGVLKGKLKRRDFKRQRSR